MNIYPNMREPLVKEKSRKINSLLLPFNSLAYGEIVSPQSSRRGGYSMKSLKGKKTGPRKQSSSKKVVDATQGNSERLREDKLDKALADTFPASDPLPWTSDVKKSASETKAEKDAKNMQKIERTKK